MLNCMKTFHQSELTNGPTPTTTLTTTSNYQQADQSS
jgi:hypothetical protein